LNLILDVSNFDKPAVECSVNQRLLGSPTEWIRVSNSSTGYESASFLKVLSDDFISILDVLSVVSGNSLGELTVTVDWAHSLTWLNQSRLNASLIILFSKTWSAMDNTCTSSLGNERSTDNREAVLLSHVLEKVE
jgi:hypothetical protein